MKIWVDGQPIAADTEFELRFGRDHLDQDVFRAEDPVYRRGVSAVTATMELPAVDAAWLYDAPAERTLRFLHVSEFHWSRWRRWLNGFLRFMWWPLGPPPLPTHLETEIDLPHMRIDRVRNEGDTVRVDFSSRSER